MEKAVEQGKVRSIGLSNFESEIPQRSSLPRYRWNVTLIISKPIFTELAKKYGETNVQIILRWHIQEGNVIFPKSTNPQHIKNNFDIFDFELTAEEMSQIRSLDRNICFYNAFSLANEQYEVGIIEKGNTEIVAEIIAEKTGADLFKITATTEYPTTYDGLLDISRKKESDPPQLSETVDNMADMMRCLSVIRYGGEICRQ